MSPAWCTSQQSDLRDEAIVAFANMKSPLKNVLKL